MLLYWESIPLSLNNIVGILILKDIIGESNYYVKEKFNFGQNDPWFLYYFYITNENLLMANIFRLSTPLF